MTDLFVKYSTSKAHHIQYVTFLGIGADACDADGGKSLLSVALFDILYLTRCHPQYA